MIKTNRKILINTSNLKVGGGLQVAVSFLNNLKYLNYNFKYTVILSPKVSELINTNDFPQNFKFYKLSDSPANLINRYKIVKQLNQIELKNKPDIVLTIFGPSYWKPNNLHIIGIGDGWIYNPGTIAYKTLDIRHYIYMKMLRLYKIYYLKRDGQYFIVETNDAKEKLSKYCRIEKDKIFVVSNCLNEIFNKKEFLNPANPYYIKLPNKEKNEIRLVYIAYPYPNKNIPIIKKVIDFNKDCFNIKFVLTLPNDYYEKVFNIFRYNNYIINLGIIPIYSCPSVYSQCDALFFPSLLETFSTSYLEAMKMGLPILTSDLDFAREICGDAAIYFNPLDAQDILKKIKAFYSNKALKDNLIKQGRERLATFISARERAIKYIEIIMEILQTNLKK